MCRCSLNRSNGIAAGRGTHEGQLAIELEFSQPLAAGQSFDELLVVTGPKGEPVKGSWVLDDTAHKLRFPYVEARAARVRGLSRRLEQGSPDHRGTPSRLGRVATLVAAEGAHVGGLVYALAPAEADAILAALDEREQGGYDRVTVRAERSADASEGKATPAPDLRSWSLEVDLLPGTYVVRAEAPWGASVDGALIVQPDGGVCSLQLP